MDSLPLHYLRSPYIYIYIYLNNFIYVFWAVLGLRCCMSFSLVAVSGGYSWVVVHRLLVVMVSLVAELRL